MIHARLMLFFLHNMSSPISLMAVVGILTGEEFVSTAILVVEWGGLIAVSYLLYESTMRRCKGERFSFVTAGASAKVGSIGPWA